MKSAFIAFLVYRVQMNIFAPHLKPWNNKMEKPYIDANTNLPEITVKAVVLGAVLSIVLSAANAYFGLFAGLTVSASIPAAVISMALLKAFKNSNILENNLVQTAASAGESLAAGVIFTMPALVIMGYWEEFPAARPSKAKRPFSRNWMRCAGRRCRGWSEMGVSWALPLVTSRTEPRIAQGPSRSAMTTPSRPAAVNST